MVACDLIAVALYASVPLAASAGILTIGQLLAVGLLGGAAGVLFTTAYQAYLPSLLPREQLVEGNAKMQGSAAAARLGGPGLAGLVAQALGVITALLFNAASFLVSCVCLIAIRTPAPRPPRASCRQTIRADIAEGVRFVSRDSPAVRWPQRSAFAERCGSCSASLPCRARSCSRTPSGRTGTCLPRRATPALRAPRAASRGGRPPAACLVSGCPQAR